MIQHMVKAPQELQTLHLEHMQLEMETVAVVELHVKIALIEAAEMVLQDMQLLNTKREDRHEYI